MQRLIRIAAMLKMAARNSASRCALAEVVRTTSELCAQGGVSRGRLRIPVRNVMVGDGKPQQAQACTPPNTHTHSTPHPPNHSILSLLRCISKLSLKGISDQERTHIYYSGNILAVDDYLHVINRNGMGRYTSIRDCVVSPLPPPPLLFTSQTSPGLSLFALQPLTINFRSKVAQQLVS